MAATTISRSTWTDGASGTVIANARLQGDVYDKIDALIAANIVFGGTISAEGFGTHTLSVGGTGRNELIVRNSSAGTTNMGRVAAQGDGASPAFISMDMASSTFTTSGGLVASGGRLFCGGTAGLAIETNDNSGIRFYGGFSNLRATINATHGLLAENAYGIKIKNTGGNAIDGIILTSTNEMRIGSDNDANVDDTVISAGSSIRFRMNSAERIVMTATGVLQVPDGSGAAPTYSFSSDTDTGMFQEDAGVVSIASNGQKIVDISRVTNESYSVTGETVLILPSRAVGTGNIAGHALVAGNNSSGSGAAGCIRLYRRSIGSDFIWSDGGTLRIGSTAPRENDATAHNSGTIIGEQTSSRDSKQDIQRFLDRDEALRTVREAPLYSFSYKPGCGLQGERFTGIITDESPTFGMDRDVEHPGGKSLNTVTSIGYLMACVQVLADRVEALEA